MFGKIKKEKQFIIYMIIFNALAMGALVCILIVRGFGNQEAEAGTGVVVSSDTPAMVVIDTPEAPYTEITEFSEQTAVSENLSVVVEVPDEDLTQRLSRVDGMVLKPDTGYILVGDSRFVYMNQVLNITDKENLFVVAKVGEGYRWFSTTALPQIKRIISSNLFNKWKIVICLGVNDLDSLSQYTQKYNELKEKYDISLVSVNPITSYGNLSNERIETFNNGIQGLGLPYIDTYRLLKLTGYTTTDGLHYDSDTSRKVYNGILMGLEDENPEVLTNDAASVLDNNALGLKKSIQKEITEENKPTPKAVSADTAAAGQTNSEVSQNTTETEIDQSSETTPETEKTGHELTQEEVDELYGIKRDEENSHEDEHDDDDDDDDDDDE